MGSWEVTGPHCWSHGKGWFSVTKLDSWEGTGPHRVGLMGRDWFTQFWLMDRDWSTPCWDYGVWLVHAVLDLWGDWSTPCWAHGVWLVLIVQWLWGVTGPHREGIMGRDWSTSCWALFEHWATTSLLYVICGITPSKVSVCVIFSILTGFFLSSQNNYAWMS